MKGLLILADGFEDSEGLTTLDCLRRAGLVVDTCSLENKEIVTTSHKVKVLPDKMYKDTNLGEYEFLVIPGGAAVFNVLRKSTDLKNCVLKFVEEEKYIFSICAAPSILSALGVFEGKKYTCFPGCDAESAKGKNTGKEIEVLDKYITARAMYYSADFALEIIEKLLGKAKRKEIEDAIKGKREKGK